MPDRPLNISEQYDLQYEQQHPGYEKQPLPRQVVYDAIESERKFKEKKSAGKRPDQLEAIELVRQIAALCVEYMEQNGAPVIESSKGCCGK